MNVPIFISMLFTLQCLYWLVGRRASKNLNSSEDYYLAGKSVRFFPLMMTFLATQVGGGVILGAADEAFQFGWPVLLYPLGSALGLIALGAGIGRKLAGFKVSTVAQIFEVVYGSKLLKKTASILSVISLFMILVAQIIASNKFLISMGLSNTPLFIAFWAIVIIYTAKGGLKAVISTDMVQAAFFSMVFLACFGFVFFSDPAVSLIRLPQLENFANVSSKLTGWLLMPLLFMVIEQDMGQRCFAGASPKIVSRAALIAGICTMIVCIVPVFFGSLASAIGMIVPKGGSVLMTAISQTTNPWITALVGCAVLAAIISTATSLINAISSNMSNDFQFTFLQQASTMRLAQGMTCAISMAAIFFAFYFDNIVDLLIQSYELSVSCLFIPIFIALFKKEGNFLAALMAILFGVVGFMLFRIYPLPFPKEIASIALSLFGFGIGELAARCKVVREQINFDGV
ncbi:MAG: sodium:solute symporter family protein [Candidatus Protochlamydia sp.]|nr:sodium:solute symporter family protein [Candidatus Protochlamydia sp.]